MREWETHVSNSDYGENKIVVALYRIELIT